MFPNLNIFSSLTKSIFSNPFSKDIIARFKAKRASGNTRNATTRMRPRHRGRKVYTGTNVTAGAILFLQKKLRVHPGLNVGIAVDNTIYAMRPGRVVMTAEKFEPRWTRSKVAQAYGHRKDAPVIYKKYYHVITEHQHNNFNLVDLV